MRVIVIGGGVMGWSLAFWLTGDPAFSGEVVVIERDPTWRWASSARSASSVRHQFTTPVNIEIGLFATAFLRGLHGWLEVSGESPDPAFHEGGYLFLARDDAALARLAELATLQRRLGAKVAVLDAGELKARFPWLNVEDVAGGSLGLEGEGWFDGWGLLRGFCRRARAQGAELRRGEVAGARASGRRVRAVRLADGEEVTGDVFVLAAGAWSGKVAELFGVHLPVEARRRSVFAFTTPEPPASCPLVIDVSGVWLRPEGTGFLCGAPPPPERDRPDLPLGEVDHELFEETIWPALAHRVPAFERLRVTSFWSGYYEMNTFDANGLVGPHPGLDNLFCLCGFSGHGLQQAPAVGRGLAELLVHGRYRTLDLSPLDPGRITRGEPLVERHVI